MQALQSLDALTLLEQWHNGIRIAQIAHSRAAAHYKLLGRMLGVPVTILTLVVGTSIFVTLTSSKDERVLLLVGVISMLAAVLSGLQTFLNYTELAVKHHAAGNKYGQLRRRAEEVMTFTKDLGELQKTMADLRGDWEHLEEESPDVPQRFHDAALRIATPKLAQQRGNKD
jgi:hypothetical protein